MKEKDFFQFQSQNSPGIDIKREMNKYLRYWYLFAIGIIMCMGAAYVYLGYATPLYQISSTLLIKDEKNGSNISSAAAFSEFEMLNSAKNIDNEIQVLRSKSLMKRVLTELSLNTSYFWQRNIKDIEIYGASLPLRVIVKKLNPDAFNTSITLTLKENNKFQLKEIDEDNNVQLSEHKFGQEIRKPYGVFTIVKLSTLSSLHEVTQKNIIINFHNVSSLASHYNNKIVIEPVNKNASVLTISLTDPVPEKGKDIINKLIEVYNKEAIEDKNKQATSTIEFLDERLKFLTSELSEVEKDVEQYKRRNEITDVGAQATLYMENASDYNKKLSEWAIQIDVLESIEDYLTKQGEQYNLVPSSLNIQEATLLALIAKFNELQLERERMLRTTFPDNPLVQNINEQLENLKTNILENLRNIKQGLIITRKNLQARSGQFESRIQQVPLIERELLEINRQQSIKQDLYLYLLQKREEAGLSLAATVSSTRIIDSAEAEGNPVSPNKKMVLMAAILVGLGLPFTFIFIKDFLNDKVQTKKDVSQVTAAPILGEITHNVSKEVLVVTEKNRAPIAELFRLIRSNLKFATANKVNKVLLVTSSISGEGKTFFSINLGASLVKNGKKAIIVDLDLRKPGLLENLGLSNNRGVSDYLLSPNMELFDIIQPSRILPGLFIAGAGAICPNAPELMMSPKMGHMINKLKENFDYVIIDSSPVGQVADAFTLAEHIDSTLYMVRYNYTPKPELENINEIFFNEKLKNLMIVLNDAKNRNSDKYGYGYEEPKKKFVHI